MLSAIPHPIDHSSALTEEELMEYQEKIKQRIRNKRRNDNISKVKEDNNQKLIDNSFRMHWREGVKKKRSDLLSYFVDKKILRETIKTNPNVLIDNLQYVNEKSSNGLLRSSLEDKFEKLVADIDHVDLMNDDVIDNEQDDYHSDQRDIPISSIQSSQAELFLQKSITFNLAVNKRIKKHRESFESDYRSSNQSNRDSIGSMYSTAGSLLNIDPRTEHYHHRMYSTFEREDKVSHLVMNLINSSRKMPRGTGDDNIQNTTNDYDQDRNYLYSSSNRIKTIGFMSKIISSSSQPNANQQSAANSLPFSPMMNVMRSRSGVTPNNRMNSNLNNPTIESTGIINTDEDYSKNSLFCSLVDSVFLIGPNSNSVDNLVKSIAQAKTNSNIELKDNMLKSELDPIIVFMTQCDNPDEMFTLLPSYCFPSGVDIQVISNKSSNAVPTGQYPSKSDVPPSAKTLKANNDTTKNIEHVNTSQVNLNPPVAPKQSTFMKKQVSMLRRATEKTFKPIIDTVTHELEADGAINMVRKLTDNSIIFDGLSSIPIPNIANKPPPLSSNNDAKHSIADPQHPAAAAPHSDLKKFILGNSLQIPILSNVTNVFFSSTMEHQDPSSTASAKPSTESLQNTSTVPIVPGESSKNNATTATSSETIAPSTTTTSTVSPLAAQRSKAKTPFILLLGDHSYQQYGLALHLPMTFKYPQYGVTVHTSYVLCLMTKLPFFSYIYHILEQFDAFTGGLTFDQPVPKQDLYFPYLATLKPLNDLAIRLKKIIVPMYPYITNDSLEINNISSTSNSSYKATNNTVVDTTSTDNSIDTKCLLPNVSLTIGANSSVMSSSRKLEFLFKRSAYQEFYSTLGIKIDNDFNQTRELNKLIEKFEKTAMNFIPRQLHKLEKEKEESYLIMLWALPVLLKYLPLDQIILALGCTITEMKIIVQHKDFRVVSSIILALTQLLKPLKWCSPVIVILPDELIDFIESPVPIIIGLQKLPENFLLLERFVVIDPQERIVHLNPADVVESHTILLPHASKLVGLIRTSAETIQKLTKRKRQRHHINLESTRIPLPVELDVGSYENMQLLAAIKSFTDLVCNHIQALLNTAIQIQREKQQNAKVLRRILSKPTVVSNKNLMGLNKSMKSSKKTISTSEVPILSTTVTAHNTDTNAISNSPIPIAEIKISATNTDSKNIPVDSSKSIIINKESVETEEINISNDVEFKAEDIVDAAGLRNTTRQANAKLVHKNKNLKSTRSLSPINSSNSNQGRLSPPKTHLNNQNSGFILTNLVNNMKHNSVDLTEHHPHKPKIVRYALSTGNHNNNSSESLGTKTKPPRHSFPDNNLSHDIGTDQNNNIHSKQISPKQVSNYPINNSNITPRSRRRTMGVITSQQQHPRIRSPSSPPDSILTNYSTNALVSASTSVVAVTEEQQQHDSVMMNLPKTNISQGIRKFSPEDTSSEITNADHELPATIVNDPSNISKMESTDEEDGEERSFDKAETNSIGSTSSSLPSLKHNAPLLLLKEIGHGGLKFMEKIQDTQMFSNYCQYLKVQSNSLNKNNLESVHNDSSSQSADGNESISITTTADVIRSLPSGQKKSFLSPIPSTFRQFSITIGSENQKQSISETEPIELDALLEVFSIALTGTIAMDPDTLQAATDKYTDLYHTSPNHKLVDEIMKKYESEFKALEGNTDKILYGKSSNLDAIDAYINRIESSLSSSENPYISSQEDQDDNGKIDTAHASKNNSKVSSCPIVWCSGLACGGYSNTPYCTSICLNLWERKIQVIRQQAVFKSIVSKHHHSQLVMKDRIVQLAKKDSTDIVSKGLPSPNKRDPNYSRKRRLSSNSTNQISAHDSKAIQVLKVNLQPKIQATKHSKETMSQYEQRKDIVKNRRIEIVDIGDTSPKNHRKKSRRSSLSGRSSLGGGHKESKEIYGAGNINLIKYNMNDKHQYLIDKSSKLMLYARRSSADPATFALARYYAGKEIKSMKSKYKRALNTLKPLLLRYIAMYRKYKFHTAIYTIQALARGFFVRNRIPILVRWLIDRKKERLLACIRIRRFLRLNDAIIYKRFMIVQREKQRKRLQRLSLPVKVSGNIDSRNIVPMRLTSDSLNQINKMTVRNHFLDAKQTTTSQPVPSSSPINIATAKEKSVSNEKLVSDKSNEDNLDSSSQAANVNKNNLTATRNLRNSATYTDRVKEYLQFGKIISRVSNISNSSNSSTLIHKRLTLERERSQNITVDTSFVSPQKSVASSLPLPTNVEDTSQMKEDDKISNTSLSEQQSMDDPPVSRFTPRENEEESTDENSSNEKYESPKRLSEKSNESIEVLTPTNTSRLKQKSSLFDMLKQSSPDHSNSTGNINDGLNDDLVSVASCSTKGGVETIISDGHSSKKFSPLGRYVADTNMDLKNIISPRSDPTSVTAPSKAGVSFGRGRSSLNSTASVDSDSLTNAETIYGSDGVAKKPSRRKSFWSTVQAGKKGGGGLPDMSDMKTVSSNNSGTDDVEDGVISKAKIVKDSPPQRPKSIQLLQHQLENEATLVVNENDTNQNINSSNSQNPNVVVSSKDVESDGSNYDDYDNDSYADDEYDNDDTPIDDILDTVKAVPLRTLGPNAVESLNRQQMHKLLDMWNLLRNGVNILKHGHHGKPKFKTLFCDINMTKFYWRSNDITQPDPALDNTTEDLIRHPFISLTSSSIGKNIPPTDLIDAPNTVKKNRTRMNINSFIGFATGKTNYMIGTKSDSERQFYLKDILEVRDDCTTLVMQRSLRKQYISEHLTSIISIVFENTTFDFEIEEELWGSLYHALKILVNYYQDIVPSIIPGGGGGGGGGISGTTPSNSRPTSISLTTSPRPLYSYLKYDSQSNEQDLSLKPVDEIERKSIDKKNRRKNQRKQTSNRK